ncbi:hypothetical protein [Microseira wollei]|uniref:LSDAT prokaryote domain-containing protein n=1 Tax=Microseira wollei NIES-4236 TaxID=2530354 RepID=A0AAV3XFX1_9CYAN|nr:hypothetical protein [Microseira wollei]GET38352.1 hypothetical protein MiSe_31080 [Microseira wollei NIES-4236]
MEKHFSLTFAKGQTAEAIQVQEPAELPKALSQIGLQEQRPVLVVVGGASKISEASFLAIQELFVQVLGPIAETLEAYVVDGGTDAGVMRLMGQARTKIGATFPLIGVSPDGKIALPNDTNPPADSAPLEPHHTHFVLIPGSNWGDESPWLATVATLLAAGNPSVTVLLNGGEITFRDALYSVFAGRLVIVVAGSGRTADQLASVLRGEPTSDERSRQLADSGLLQVIALDDSFNYLAKVIKNLLSNQI